MPKESREIVNVTAALKNILDNYPAGSASLREILQNTDDAGAKNQVRSASITIPPPCYLTGNARLLS